MKKLSGGLILLFMFYFVQAQDKTSTVSISRNEAKQILEKAKKVVSKKANVIDVKSFTAVTEKSRVLSIGARKIPQTLKSEISFALPDKIRQKASGNQSNSTQEETYILNGGNLYSKLDVFVDGKLQNTNLSEYADNKVRFLIWSAKPFFHFFR